MANTNAPFGFRWAGRLEGSAPNSGLITRQVLASDTTKIFYGDPVTSQSTGYVAQASAGTTSIAGIFYGCTYVSTAQQKLIHSMYWPGTSDAVTGSVNALICVDPLATFLVQATSTALTIADIGANVQFTVGTGSTATGLSASTVDSPNTTSTLPFRVIGLATTLGNGGDSSTSYNQVYVTFNFQDFKQTTGV